MESNKITPNGAVSSDIPLSVYAGDGPIYGHRKAQPQHVYEITIKIEGTPGPFASFGASVSVQGKSDACGIPHGFPSGGQLAPNTVVPFELKRVSDTEFRGTFATDPLVDEVFWQDRPACEWMFVATSYSYSFSATAAKQDTGFSGSVNQSDLASGQPLKRYYWKGNYPKLADMESLESFSTDGSKDIQQIRPERRNDLFTITTTVAR